MHFADNLKTIRTRHNLTQKQLADILEITDRAIRKYESGDSQPTLPVLKKLSDYFDISIDALVSNDMSSDIEYSYIELSDDLYKKLESIAIKNNVTPSDVVTFLANKIEFDENLSKTIDNQINLDKK